MNDVDKEKFRAFVLGLEKLTRETGVIIGGCGCCESPDLELAKPEQLAVVAGYANLTYLPEEHYGQITWISPDHMRWDDYREKIVK